MTVPGDVDPATSALLLVDHGSRREESNRLLDALADAFRARGGWLLVEPAHMELADPSIGAAFDACVAGGAVTVVVFPWFLGPGRHWERDIPALVEEAAARHPGTRYLVTAPLANHPLMLDVVDARVAHCLAHARGEAPECDVCAGTGRCALRGGAAG